MKNRKTGDIDSEYSADADQRKIIGLKSGYHLVLASAGCGKTAILAARVREALLAGTRPDEMLCLTFTNRAARGMRDRIRTTSGISAEGIFVGNIHRFCSRFVYDNNIISQSSAIMDEEDSLSVISSVSDYITGNQNNPPTDLSALDFMQRARLTALMQLQHLMMQYRLGHPRGVISTNTSDYSDKNSSARFFSPNLFRNLCLEYGNGVSIPALIEIYDNSPRLCKSGQFSPQCRELLHLMEGALSYEKYKTEHNLIDFDDLLILTYTALERREKNYRKYKWIQIDEVQDLSPIQFAIIDRLTAPEHVTLYLGDGQQAIFSFIGARLQTLEKLKQRCADNIHHLGKCYRSPRYLLDIFNDYAAHELETAVDFLPEPINDTEPEHGDLTMYYANTSASAQKVAARMAINNDDGRTAILVSTNQEAEMVSKALGNTPHFKISGTDLFSLSATKTLLSHINLLADDINHLAWARLLYGLKITPSFSKAREFVLTLKNNHMTPSDLLVYNESSYILEYLKAWESDDVVIFDTETTGLEVYEDDIVQIAANRYRKGRLTGSLNLILETSRDIPAKLGELDNPLISEYARRSHEKRNEGLKKFIEFASGSILVGHNVDFDFNILDNNLARALPEANASLLFPSRFDTLRLSRLLHPNLRSYRLGGLLEELSLAGSNTHLADADIDATFSLACHCARLISEARESHELYLRSLSGVSKRLKETYGEIYFGAKEKYYLRVENQGFPLVNELKRAYAQFIEKGLERLPKFNYIIRFLENCFLVTKPKISLHEEVSRHIMDINTLKESDLCDSSVVDEKIFVATVHKAKGLEFENVIVYGCVDGNYPFFATQFEPEQRREDARKLYVALTRARKRLCLMVYDNKIVKSSRNGQSYRFPAKPSPFLEYVLKRHKFLTLHE